jgi:hypothetical protein
MFGLEWVKFFDENRNKPVFGRDGAGQMFIEVWVESADDYDKAEEMFSPRYSRMKNMMMGMAGGRAGSSGNAGKGLLNAVKQLVEKCRRGPKPWPSGAHNQKIIEEIEKLKAQGHTHTHGGSLTEEVVQTPHGQKTTRRPDITTTDPNGGVYRENVGKTKADGSPVTRETDALDDIEQATGQRPGYTPYDR